jgi:transcriptional regulator with XRE-family HTH domain
MPKTKKWSEIRDTLSKPGVAEHARAHRKQRAALLGDVRRARQLTQETLADALGMKQPEVSKIERRADLYVSTLRRYIEAMGGSLEITAHFPGGDIEVITLTDEPEMLITAKAK